MLHLFREHPQNSIKYDEKDRNKCSLKCDL